MSRAVISSSTEPAKAGRAVVTTIINNKKTIRLDMATPFPVGICSD